MLCQTIAERAITDGIYSSGFQAALAEYNHSRLNPGVPITSDAYARNVATAREMDELEYQFIESERAKISHLAAEAPIDPELFIEWYQDLIHRGPGQNDRLFDWLAETAERTDMAWFISQELVGEAGFDDLLSLTLLRMPTQVKLEISRNFWDEMGRGKESGMHGPMLDLVAEELKVVGLDPDKASWQALSLGNLMVGLAINRQYAYHSVGCLGAVELTAPGRCVKVTEGLERVGLSRNATSYYRLHGSIDIRHSREWNDGVILPLVKNNPGCARYIAEGALMRLNAGARNFDFYRSYYQLDSAQAHIN